MVGVDDAGGGHRILLGDGRQHLSQIEAEGGELLRRDREIVPLVLGTEDGDLGDIGLGEEGRARLLGEIPYLAPAEAIEGQAVDYAEDVAEFVVEIRALDAGRQGLPD